MQREALTATQWESFTERIAILEYDADLDRKSAALRSFELCFPGDYQGRMRISADHPDRETALYEYLEGLIKLSRTHEKGPSMSSKTKNVKSPIRQALRKLTTGPGNAS
jgi:hypothetical protein